MFHSLNMHGKKPITPSCCEKIIFSHRLRKTSTRFPASYFPCKFPYPLPLSKGFDTQKECQIPHDHLIFRYKTKPSPPFSRLTSRIYTSSPPTRTPNTRSPRDSPAPNNPALRRASIFPFTSSARPALSFSRSFSPQNALLGIKLSSRENSSGGGISRERRISDTR